MCSIMFDFGCVSGGLLTYLWLIQSTSVQWLVTPFNTRLQLSFSLSSKSQVVSIVLSSQVGNGLTATAVSKDTLESNPISLTFNLISVCCYSCCSMFVVYYGLYIFAGKWNNQIQVCVLEFFWTVSCNSYNLICVSQLNLTRTLFILCIVLVRAAGSQMELASLITWQLGMLHQCSARAPISPALQC